LNAVANLANLTSLNDERLLIQAAQSDPSRFAELYESNFNRVYAFVARRVKDREEAQDVTADVFHQALRNLGGFQWRGVPFAAVSLRTPTRWRTGAARGTERGGPGAKTAN
jgi:RNA polymerase sigma-70 factor (ECF subfamily)